MRLFVNFFQPSFKLAEKKREGALIRRRYHPPLTPHQRLVADTRVPQELKDALDAQHAALDPVSLLRDIRAAQRALIEIADTAAATTSDAPPLEAFLEGLKVAGAPRAKCARRRSRRPQSRATAPFPILWKP